MRLVKVIMLTEFCGLSKDIIILFATWLPQPSNLSYCVEDSLTDLMLIIAYLIAVSIQRSLGAL